MKLSGIYLIADASLPEAVLLKKVTESIQNGVKLLQLYGVNNSVACSNKVRRIIELCHSLHALVLINNHWQFALNTAADGVHFDQAPQNMDEINEATDGKLIKGLTLGNNLALIDWAHKHQFDYFSFCSMFPSASAGDCEIVNFESVQKAKKLTSLPLFAAGGITLTNVERLSQLPIDGIAVISSIMNAQNAGEASRLFNDKFQTKNKL